MRTMRTKVVLATLLVALIAVVPVLAVAGASAKSSKPKPPIKIGLIGTITGAVAFPEIVTGDEAAITAINKAGGLDGRKLELFTCDNQLNENLDASCGQKMVADHVVALVGGFAIEDGHYAYTDAAHIPAIGTYQTLPETYVDQYEFPLSSYSLAGRGGPIAALAYYDHVKHIVYISGTTAGVTAPALEAPLNNILAPLHETIQGVVFMPPGTADPTPYLEQAIHMGATGLGFGVSQGDDDRLTQLLHQIAPNIRQARDAATINAGNIKTLGAALNNVTISSQFLPSSDTANPGVKAWVTQMRAYSKTAVYDDFSANSWSAVEVFAQVVARIKGAITSAAVLKELRSNHTWNEEVGPSVNFAKPQLGNVVKGTNYTRVFRTGITYNEIKNGKLVNITGGKFYNPWAGDKLVAGT